MQYFNYVLWIVVNILWDSVIKQTVGSEHNAIGISETNHLWPEYTVHL